MTDKERASELGELIVALQNCVKSTRTVLDNPGYVERTVLHLSRQVAKAQQEIVDLLATQSEGPERIRAWQDRIATLSTERKQLEHRSAIERMIAMQQEMNRLEGNIAPDDLDDANDAHNDDSDVENESDANVIYGDAADEIIMDDVDADEDNAPAADDLAEIDALVERMEARGGDDTDA